MTELTFEQLPNAFVLLFNKVENIERLIAEKDKGPQSSGNDLLTVKEASDYLHVSSGAIYAMVHRRAIPASKRGKRLFFSKKSLSEWIEAGRKPTAEEIKASARKQLSHSGNKAV